jgi:predicted transcriptional regulator
VGEFRKPLHLPADNYELRVFVSGLAARVAELEEMWRATGNRGLALAFSDEKLAVIATWLYSERIYRSGQFNPALFGEPAWDMLLDLFIQKVAGRRVCTTSLCLGANVPQTTGLRYIALLEEEGLVIRSDAMDDKRLSLVDFTAEGFKRMRQYLSLTMTRFKGPAPD